MAKYLVAIRKEFLVETPEELDAEAVAERINVRLIQNLPISSKVSETVHSITVDRLRGGVDGV